MEFDFNAELSSEVGSGLRWTFRGTSRGTKLRRRLGRSGKLLLSSVTECAVYVLVEIEISLLGHRR